MGEAWGTEGCGREVGGGMGSGVCFGSGGVTVWRPLGGRLGIVWGGIGVVASEGSERAPGRLGPDWGTGWPLKQGFHDGFER